MEEEVLEGISLTKRELSILQKVALGYTTPRIAETFGLSPETIKWYRKQLLAKFSAATSAEMVRKAMGAHII